MSGRPHPESERPLYGPLQSFNLNEEIARLRQEEAWQHGQRNAITLRKGQGLNVVLLVMRSGDRLEEHSAPGPISLSVRRGVFASRPGMWRRRLGRRRCSRAMLGYAT